MPPVVAAPCFAIRRPAVAVFTLNDYVGSGIMSAAQAELLRIAVHERKNVLVAGGTSTGKTTLVNALLAEVAKTGDSVLLCGLRGGSLRSLRLRAFGRRAAAMAKV